VINRAVVRDGKPYPPSSLDELEILPGTAEALGSLKELGFVLIVVTNQPDVARGTQSRESVERMHAALLAQLPIDHVLTCYHDDADGCACRKPRPGLLLEAARRYGVELQKSFLVGDRWRDIDAGHAAGCRTVLIDYAYRERAPMLPPEAKVATLGEAVELIRLLTGDPDDTTGRPES
jgi:D-glycero-D-manno-heptose 1,7-bisphosphate phosphatase